MPDDSGLLDDLRAAREVVDALKRRLTLAEDATAAGRFALHKAMARLEDAVRDRTREVEASEARHRALFEHSPDMLLLVDERGLITAVNRASVEGLGKREAELRGTALSDLFSPRSTPRDRWLDPDAGEQEHTLLAGRQVTATVARLPGAERVVLVSLRDTTAKRALAHAQRLAALGQLAAGVAHEINNPLAVLQMGLEQHSLRLTDANARKELGVLIEHCERIARIVENLNDFARPRTPTPEASPVRSLIETAATLARRALAPSQWSLELEPETLTVYADRGQIEQVLVNLLSNAGRAAGASGRVLVRARAADQDTVIEVLDDGPGIDPVLLPQLFSPFVTNTGGMGLGLAISWSLVQENSGRLRAENGVPRGAAFVLTLPRGPERSVRPEPAESAAPVRNLRVLCVEDELVLRNLLATMLRELGHVPTAVRTAEEALTALGRDAYDVVLTDIQLPGESGHALYESIARSHPELAPRVILMSGHFQTGATHQLCLQKPFGFEELSAAIASVAR